MSALLLSLSKSDRDSWEVCIHQWSFSSALITQPEIKYNKPPDRITNFQFNTFEKTSLRHVCQIYSQAISLYRTLLNFCSSVLRQGLTLFGVRLILQLGWSGNSCLFSKSMSLFFFLNSDIMKIIGFIDAFTKIVV